MNAVSFSSTLIMYGILKTNKKLYATICLVIVFTAYVFAENEMSQRERRAFFIFPMGGIFKLIMGLAIPVQLGLKQSMAFGMNLQFQFPVAQNYSEFENYPPIISKSREKRQTSLSDRASVYLFLESLMTSEDSSKDNSNGFHKPSGTSDQTDDFRALNRRVQDLLTAPALSLHAIA